jgi:hypothetical protein
MDNQTETKPKASRSQKISAVRISTSTYNLYPMDDEDVEMLYECIGISPEELSELRENALENAARTLRTAWGAR